MYTEERRQYIIEQPVFCVNIDTDSWVGKNQTHEVKGAYFQIQSDLFDLQFKQLFLVKLCEWCCEQHTFYSCAGTKTHICKQQRVNDLLAEVFDHSVKEA